METIISSLIAAAATLIVCLVQNRKTVALIEYKMTELEKKVDKHNNLIERTYRLEEGQAVLAEKVKVANHRIDDLEKGA